MANNAVQNRINTMRVIGVLQLIFGWFLTVLFGVTAIASFADIKSRNDFDTNMTCLIIAAVSSLLIIFGAKKMKLIKTFRNYSSQLTADPVKSIDTLAASMGVSVVKAKKKITSMLSHGLFPNAFIDNQSNCLVFTNHQNPLSQSASNAAVIPVSYTTIQCQGCGAINKIARGGVVDCEFCGSSLSSEA